MDKLQHDIERYLKGELSPAEMHALEKRALSDPFLADALEGAGRLSPVQFMNDVDDLQARLKRVPAGKQVSMLGWMARIAAGVVFFILAGIFIYNLSSSGGSEQRIAENQVEKSPSPKKEAEPLVQLRKDSITVSPNATEEKEEAASQQTMRSRAHAETDGSAAADDAASAPSAQQPAATEVPLIAENQPLAEQEDLIIPEPVAKSAPAYRETKEDKEIARSVVTGQVLDSEDGKGLPGVNVTIRGTNIGTVTDEEGRYQIPMDSLNDGLLFSFIGFESREAVPGNSGKLDVTLSPDIAQLSEVVVVGYSSTKEPEELPVIEMAAPAGGRKAYKQYLEQGLRYPEQALNNKVEGKVTVQFTIESNGKVGEFQVLKGIGYGCDEEVIRLIKEGPRWVPTRKNKEPVRDKVKVRLRFALPKKP
jgi:TonB family protein